MTENEIADWAWRQIAIEDLPSHDLLEPATDASQKYLKRAAFEFSRRRIELNLVQEFSLHAASIQSGADQVVLELIKWAAERVIIEDITEDSVQLGYQWDQLINDFANAEAVLALAKTELPQMMPRCNSVAADFAIFRAEPM